MKKFLALLAGLILSGQSVFAAQQTLSNSPAGIVTPANANFTELYGKLPSEFNVKSFGASSDGSNLAATTVAIQAAYTAACANTHGTAKGGVVFFPPGQYASGPVYQSCARVYTVGSGRGNTSISFTPTGDATTITADTADPGTWLVVARDDSSPFPQIGLYGGIRDISITTTDTTHKKNAIYVAEFSQYYAERFTIDQFWGANSVGVRVAGHEIFKAEDYFVSATIPFSIDKGLVAYGGTKYNDSYQFINGYTRAPHGSDPSTYYPTGAAGGFPNTNYFIADGVFVSDWTFDRMNWVGGANAIYWKQTLTSSSVSYKFSIHHGRKEQSGGTNAPADAVIGFVFDFTGAPQRLNDLNVEDVYVSGTHTDSGIYAHSVNNLLLKDFEVAGYTADSLFVMDVDNVFHIDWIDVQTAIAGSPSTINWGANEGTARNCVYRQNVNLPLSCTWTFESAPRVTKTMASGTTSNWATVFGVSSDIGGLDFPRGVTDIYVTTTAGAATSTGLPPPDSTTGLFSHGNRIRLHNANGGNKLTLAHNSSSETTASHRYECALATDADVLPGQWRLIQYDFTLSRWVVE